ncbi:IS66 family transposase [Paraburkholderia fungorum]|uniref:IS66 family transposase n=1 Tax=Paraburkholderia fungorum TaxID=134537 RepID=UPI000945A7C7
MCDDYGRWKTSFRQSITEMGCASHARPKFFDLHANYMHARLQGWLSRPSLPFAVLYDIEHEACGPHDQQKNSVREALRMDGYAAQASCL